MNKNNLDLFMGQFTIRETLLLTPFRINIYRCFNRFWFQSSHDTIPGFSKTNGKSSLETEKNRWPRLKIPWLLQPLRRPAMVQQARNMINWEACFRWRRPLSDRTVVSFIHGHDATLHTWGGGGMLTFMWSAYGVDATLHTWGGGGHVNVHVKCIQCRCYVAYMGWGGAC